MTFRGKVALITGSAKGIGRGTALAFAEEGAAIAINYRNSADAAEEAARLVREKGVEAHVFQADVGFKDQVERLFERVIDRFGRLDFLVNNAGGGGGRADYLDVTEEQFDYVLRNNVKASFLCTQYAARQMIKQGTGGAIVNITSIMAHTLRPGSAIYSVAKQAMEKLTQSQALELSPFNIRVNAVAPGFVDIRLTPDDRGPAYEEMAQRNISIIPVRRSGKPIDIGRAVVFLCSDEAHYVTGASLLVDGGLLLMPNH